MEKKHRPTEEELLERKSMSTYPIGFKFTYYSKYGGNVEGIVAEYHPRDLDAGHAIFSGGNISYEGHITSSKGNVYRLNEIKIEGFRELNLKELGLDDDDK